MNATFASLHAHWRLIAGACAGWALDAFDFTILLFLIPHLGKVFDASLPQMALVVTATGLAKVVGTVGWGIAADRFGRKLPFLIAILWFSCFAGLSGLAWSYASFLVLRTLFGIGFGGEWSASVALVMETVPEQGRALASGIIMAGYEFGYLLSALCFHFLFPSLGWRWMFFLGALPALLTLVLRSRIQESPEWLRQRKTGRNTTARLSINPAVVQAWGFAGVINFMLWAVQVLYPTFLLTVQRLDSGQIFPFIVLYSVGSVIGKPLSGYLMHRLGERVTVIGYMLIVIPSTALYVLVDQPALLGLGALLMGLFANGLFGIMPIYLSRRFAVESRATGIGISYAMTSLSVAAPYIIALVTPHLGLTWSMGSFIAGGAFLLAVVAAFDTRRWIPTVAAPPAPPVPSSLPEAANPHPLPPY